ncbi:hypothetical protein F443_06995, partial [Phytophthora nicotianae P1569]
MDLALTILDGLRQIYGLRDAIRRQRHENRKTYLRMMEIYVELQLSAPLQENPTIQRTNAIEKFASAVDSFSKYLRKYHDMHRVVRMFKHAKMEEKRQKIASEIDQLFRMLNLAATVTMMNEQATASSNAAKLFAKLEDMHGDIRLSHDQIHAALLADRQQLELVKEEKVLDERGPAVEKRAATRVREERYLAQSKSIDKKPPAVIVESAVVKNVEEYPTAEMTLDNELEEKALPNEFLLMQDTTEDTVRSSALDESGDDVDAEEKALVITKYELDQSTANVVVGATVVPVQKIELAGLKQTSAGDDAEDKTPTGEEPALMENVVDQVDEEKEAPPQSPLSSSTPLDESSVPRLIQLLGSDHTTEQQKERALLHLMSMCVTSSNRVQVYKTKGIPVLTDLVHNSDNFFTQLYALHCLSWFTFSYSKMSESAFMKLQECAREPTHSEILSILHEL